MRLRQTWLAVSITKSTVMFSSVPSNIVMPPLGDAREAKIRLDLASGQPSKPREFWLAISQEDGVS